jgi:diguanylate cyclase (GGDEF)-like protein
MISLRNSVSDLERCHESRDIALECYIAAIRNIAHYAVELDARTTAVHRKYLEDLATQLSGSAAEALVESRATVRGLMREHRDRTSQYLSELQRELTDAVGALEQTLEAIGQSDGDHGVHLRKAIAQLRSVPASAGNSVRTIILAATSAIEASLEEVRKQHQLTVAQFVMEIRVLHKRIDGLESAASIDRLTQLFNREEMEARIKGLQAAKITVLLLKAGGLRVAETHFGREVAAELAGAFTKRLRNSMPSTAVIGRWSEEGFVAILQADQNEVAALAKRIAENLGGAYSCLKEGKTVRTAIQLSVGIVDPQGDGADRVLQRVGDFLSLA